MSRALSVVSNEEDRQVIAFSLKESSSFGRDAAIFLDRLRYWVRKNIDAERNRFEGRTWSFSTQNEIAAHIGVSERQARRLVKKLKDAGLIMIRQLHDDTRNRTNWYAFVDEDNALQGPLALPTCPVHADILAASSIETVTEEETELQQRPAGAMAIVIPLKLKEGGGVTDDTKSRNEAFRAVRGDGGQTGRIAPDESEDRRGDMARRRERDGRLSRPKKAKPPKAAPRPRAVPQSAVFEAWRNAMNAKGIPTVQAPERRDVEDGNRIIEKAGSEAQAIAYAVWTVENWGTLTKKFPKLDDYGMTFGTISGGWMRSLFPMAVTAIAAPPVEGSPFFLEYMAKTVEEKAAMNPQLHHRKFQGFAEYTQAMKTHMDAQKEINTRKVPNGN